MRRARREEGFTLLEVAIAMALLAGGLLVVAAAQLTALGMSSRSKNLMTAVHLAQQQIEAFQAMPTASLPASGNDPFNPIDPDPSDDDETLFNRRWTIQPDTPATGVTSITVEVDWFDPKIGITRTTSIETFKGS